MTDFSRYQEWNPFIVAVKGKALAGERLNVKVRLPGLLAISFVATLRSCVFPVRLGWQAIFLQGFFKAHHSFTIERLDAGRSRFIHAEEFSGILCAPILLLLEKRFREGYRLMNEALKALVERS